MAEMKRIPIILKEDMAELEQLQNQLANSLVRWARENNIAAKDWVQGGWTRSSDKIDLGWRIAGALQENM